MARRLLLLATLALVAASCSGSPVDQSADAAPQPSAERTATATPTLAPVIAADETVSDSPGSIEAPDALLLPDPERWVVIEDWNSKGGTPTGADGFVDDMQLDVAPLGKAGVPQLGRRITVTYRLGTRNDFEQRWGSWSTMGEQVDFAVDDGIGRIVQHADSPFSTALVWIDGMFVFLGAGDRDTDLIQLANSLTQVDQQTWAAARAGAPDQRLIAVQAAMQTIEPLADLSEPLPHWVLPEPWEVEWVTDKTIWTTEQHAQAAGLAEAGRRPGWSANVASRHETWRFGFGEDAERAIGQFVPHIDITVLVFDQAPTGQYPSNYETISALGLDGVIAVASGAGNSVELGTGEVRVNVTTRDLPRADLVQFLGAIEFASADPLDGFVLSDDRFQAVDLPVWQSKPPNWHAYWKHPERSDGVISVWRLSVPELRNWLSTSRGDALKVPDNVWEMIAADEVIDFGFGTTYDPSTNLLISLRGIELDELIPIELDDWIAFVAPANTDPLNPR